MLEIINEYTFKNEMILNTLPLFSYSFILLGTILSVFRHEGNLLIYVLGILLTLSFIGTISELIL